MTEWLLRILCPTVGCTSMFARRWRWPLFICRKLMLRSEAEIDAELRAGKGIKFKSADDAIKWLRK